MAIGYDEPWKIPSDPSVGTCDMRIGSALATDESGTSLDPCYDRVRSGVSVGQRKQYHRSRDRLPVAVRTVKVLR